MKFVADRIKGLAKLSMKNTEVKMEKVKAAIKNVWRQRKRKT